MHVKRASYVQSPTAQISIIGLVQEQKHMHIANSVNSICKLAYHFLAVFGGIQRWVREQDFAF
jgi:hypothetical protein